MVHFRWSFVENISPCYEPGRRASCRVPEASILTGSVRGTGVRRAASDGSRPGWTAEEGRSTTETPKAGAERTSVGEEKGQGWDDRPDEVKDGLGWGSESPDDLTPYSHPTATRATHRRNPCRHGQPYCRMSVARWSVSRQDSRSNRGEVSTPLTPRVSNALNCPSVLTHMAPLPSRSELGSV